MQFNIAGRTKNQNEIPEALNTLNSLFLFNFINVCIEPNRKVVGKIIGNKEGKCKKEILIKISILIPFDAPLRMSSTKSIAKNNVHIKKNKIAKDKRFSFDIYLRIKIGLII